MEGSQFDVWTRRRFGLAAGGLSASLLAVTGVEAKKKRKKKKKKKCIKLGQECDPDGKACCDCLACGPIFDGLVENVCCRPGSTPCSIANAAECCSGQCVGDFCFCKSNGNPCSVDTQCCSFNCLSNQCAPLA
jgi:hypothetical protein